MEERFVRIYWALCPGLEPSTYRKLFAYFQSAISLQEASEEEWMTAARIRPETVVRMRNWRAQTTWRFMSIEERLKEKNIHCIVRGDEAYPSSLLTLFDPPITLFAKGSPTLLNKPICVSVVGTRRASSYGLEATRWIASSLAKRGAVICSGLALGIDATAHRATLDADGETVAILGCGVDVCYPPSHRRLYEEISERGLLISEYAPSTLAAKHRFPERNRIIAALSRLTVVIQAGEKSGALGTAMTALDLGHDVYVVPGPITTKSFRGSHQLLFDGATPLVDPDALVQNLYPNESVELELGTYGFPAHLQALGRMIFEEGPLRAGELAQLSGQPPSHIYAALLELELGAFVERLPDGRYKGVRR